MQGNWHEGACHITQQDLRIKAVQAAATHSSQDQQTLPM